VKTAPFRYERPRSLEDALELLRDEEAKPIAGGQSLVPMMAMRLARPRTLVDLGRISDLTDVRPRDGALEIGATVRQRALERRPELARELPLVAAALPYIGHREIRNRGTVGGSIAHADPAAELGLVAATLGATILARSPEGKREIPAAEFVLGPFQTALRDGELLTAVSWPTARPQERFAFAEVARRHGDFALCGVAVYVQPRAERALARVGLMGVGPAPVVRQLELRTGDDPADAAGEIASGLDPSSDMHASAGYRLRLARVLAERCLRRTLGDAA
jgi:CO/xanthine dehydrogenase FAD-binding subunit